MTYIGKLIVLILMLGSVISCSRDKGPIMEIKKKEFEIESTLGDTTKFIFYVYNKGNSDLRINSFRTSCSCTNSTFTKKIITPNDSAEVVVEFIPKNLGMSVETITIESNDELNSPYTALVKAITKRKVVAKNYLGIIPEYH